MEKISIIIPAYNEEKRIENTLSTYGSYFNKLKEKKLLDYEILVVINNTKDNTEGVVKDYIRKNKNVRYLNLLPGGKGFAIIEGFKEALKGTSNLIGFVDADMATLPESYYDLIKNIKNSDCIIASRYVEGAIVSPKQPLKRIVVSRIFNIIVRMLFFMKYRDTQCGAKVFKREAIQKIIKELGITHWAIDIDLLYWLEKKGYSIKEIPTVWADKDASTLNIKKASIQMFFAVIQLRLIHSPFKKIIKFLKIIAGGLWRLLK